jgi:hypothetical protein
VTEFHEANDLDSIRAFLRERAGGRVSREEMHLLVLTAGDETGELLALVRELGIELYGPKGE